MTDMMPSTRRPTRAFLLIACALGLFLAVRPAPVEAQALTRDDWLLNAPDDQARFRLLQTQARGFSASMIEVGQRYQAMYDAIGDGNFALAAYQWDKIRDAIQTGYARRPGRQPNSDARLLQPLFTPVREAFRSGDAALARASFAEVRTACMACHEAERIGFMNNQPLFRRTAAPPN